MKVTNVLSFPALSRQGGLDSQEAQSSLGALRRALRWAQWLAPFVMVLIVVFYELGPARWIQHRFGSGDHYFAEILFYGTIGPLLTFLLFYLLGRWLEERETRSRQAQALEQANEHVRLSHEVTDDAMQALFAASITLTSLESRVPDLPPEVVSQLRATNQALTPIMQQLYAHQAKRPPSPL